MNYEGKIRELNENLLGSGVSHEQGMDVIYEIAGEADKELSNLKYDVNHWKFEYEELESRYDLMKIGAQTLLGVSIVLGLILCFS